MPSTQMGAFTLQGISLGGVYTSIYVPELRILFDVGTPIRAACNADVLCLSHAHPDHIGGLYGFLGLRGLRGKDSPLRILCPRSIVDRVKAVVDANNAFLKKPFEVDVVGVVPGDVIPHRNAQSIRIVETYHLVDSIGFLVQSTVQKLKTEFVGLSGAELAAKRAEGIVLSEDKQLPEFGFITDTLVQALDNAPELYEARVLAVEATFLDGERSVADTRRHTHIHLDELNEREALFKNKHVALIHPSQMYDPLSVYAIVQERAVGGLGSRAWPFLGTSPNWPV